MFKRNTDPVARRAKALDAAQRRVSDAEKALTKAENEQAKMLKQRLIPVVQEAKDAKRHEIASKKSNLAAAQRALGKLIEEDMR